MIYDRDYVKTLIHKRVDGVITEMESAELQAAQKIFTDEELAEIITEVFLEEEELLEEARAGDEARKDDLWKSIWKLFGGNAAM